MRNKMGFLKRIALINISIRTKLLLIYLLCVLTPTITFSFAFYTSTLSSARNEKLILYRQEVERVTTSIESNAISAIQLANTIYPDKKMYEFLDKRYDRIQECMEDYNAYLKDAWDMVLPYNTNIALFTVYTNNNTLLNGNHLQRIDYSIDRSDWYEKYSMVNDKSKPVFLYHVDELTLGAPLTKMVSYFRRLNYTKCSDYQHYIKITFRPDMLDKLLETETLPGALYIVDGENTIVAQNNRQIKTYTDTEFISFDTVKTDHGQVILRNPIQFIDGWQVVCVLNKNFMSEAFEINWMQMIVLVLSVTVFASVVIYAISSSLYKRIALLVYHMGKVSKEEYELIPEEKKGSDEIGLLINAMNRMITKIRSLIEDEYKAKIRDTQMELLKKQSELSALQCQVNPHFMFNVLETIRIKSYLRNEFETSRIIKYMSKIFRKLLLWNDDLIGLQEEINFIKEYMEIQQYRYEDELDFEISVDERLLALKIPKMTLQTLIDNACEHGFSGSKGIKKIKLTIRLINEKTVEFKVYDNGNGMTPEQIEQVRDISSMENKGIGIKNVIGRLNLYFGDNYIFKITSEPGQFTEILLVLDLEEMKRSDYV